MHILIDGNEYRVDEQTKLGDYIKGKGEDVYFICTQAKMDEVDKLRQFAVARQYAHDQLGKVAKLF
ncbi:MAG: hypothetical protein JKY22_12070 [Flavobacteriaceae bacterium]|nr:hypothetical protein [Flavobacteriaceae bacterium]PCJ26485.1 MAG: hypothetical protein COA94_05090 [Rickettsiales bacterium]